MVLPVFFQLVRAPFLCAALVLPACLITITPLIKREVNNMQHADQGAKLVIVSKLNLSVGPRPME